MSAPFPHLSISTCWQKCVPCSPRHAKPFPCRRSESNAAKHTHMQCLERPPQSSATFCSAASIPLFKSHHHCPSSFSSGQSQTVFKNCVMSTRFVFISTIQGCFMMCHGVALLVESFSRLRNCQYSPRLRIPIPTYQHSMKYLKLGLHVRLFSGSSFNLGIGCRTIYVRRSIRPARGFISVPSAGKGNRCCATSSNVTPRLQTSLVMV